MGTSKEPALLRPGAHAPICPTSFRPFNDCKSSFLILNNPNRNSLPASNPLRIGNTQRQFPAPTELPRSTDTRSPKRKIPSESLQRLPFRDPVHSVTAQSPPSIPNPPRRAPQKTPALRHQELTSPTRPASFRSFSNSKSPSLIIIIPIGAPPPASAPTESGTPRDNSRHPPDHPGAPARDRRSEESPPNPPTPFCFPHFRRFNSRLSPAQFQREPPMHPSRTQA